MSDLLENARRFGPALAARAQAASDACRISDETFQELAALGLTRACAPQEFGGYELPYRAMVDICIELGRYCGSTAWLMGVYGSHTWWLSKCPRSIQQRIWGESPDALISGAFANKGCVVQRADGGWHVSGEWLFSSGIHHCQWAAFLVPMTDAAGQSSPQFAFVPRAACEIVSTWDVLGMRATGSDNVRLTSCFVPDEMFAPFKDIDSVLAPGQAGHDSASYRLALTSIFAYSVAGPLLGTAKGALTAFIAEMSSRRSLQTDKTLTDALPVQLRIAESAAEIAAATALYESDMGLADEASRIGRPLDERERSIIKRNAAFVATLCRRATTRLMESLGARGLARTGTVQRLHADTVAGAAHLALSWDANSGDYARFAIANPSAA